MSSSFSYNFISNIANLKIFAHLKSAIMKVSYPKIGKLKVSWEESSIFFSPSQFEIQSDFDYRTSKIKFYCVRALKCYLNENNLMHG